MTTTRDATGGSTRIAQVDALRAIAALLVLVIHATEIFKQSALATGSGDWLHRLAHALDFGRIGVVVFFIISGYVIAGTLDNPATTPRRFVVRRLFRLYPLYWLSIAGACLFLVPGPIDAGTLVANITMLPTLFGKEPYMGLYWTLETELAFYVLALLLWTAGVLHRGRVLLAMEALLIAVFAGFMFGWIPAPGVLSWKALPLHLSFMAIGLLAYLWKRDGAFAPVLAAIAMALIPSAYALARFFASGGADDLRWGASYPIAVLVFMGGLNARVPGTRALASVGLVSYSIYLLHPFALQMLVGDPGSPGLYWVQRGGMTGAVAVAAFLTIVIAAIAYALVERPFNACARRITRVGPPGFEPGTKGL